MFITFEGIDNVGKTSICQCLEKRLSNDWSVSVVSDPPGLPPWADLKPTLLDDKRITSSALAMIFLAARIDAHKRIIKRRLRRGEIVLGDRFTDSWLAYQSVRNRGDFKNMKEALTFYESINESCVENSLVGVPDKTFLIVGDVAETVKRGRKKRPTVFDSPRFQREVQKIYLRIADRAKTRIEVVNSKGQNVNQLVNKLESRIRSLLRSNRTSVPVSA